MPKVLNETKHFQAAVRIRELVNTLKAGESLPVAGDLVGALNISHGTAMRALKVLADEGIIFRPLGKQRYRIADRFERISARIGMIRPDYPSHDLDCMVQRVYTAGREYNWKFNQYCFRSRDELDFARIFGESDAIVLIPDAASIDEELVRALLRPARPVVVLLQHLNHSGINNVCIDDFRAGELAAEVLFERGHRRILYLKDQPAESTMAERRRGFVSAARRLNFDCGEEFYLDARLRSFEDPQENSYRVLRARLKNGKPDFSAIFCSSLVGGIAALRALREHGLRIPEDVAVLAFSGESKLAPFLYPPLSCIEIDAEKIGQYTALLLADALKAVPVPARQMTIAPYLVLRESI